MEIQTPEKTTVSASEVLKQSLDEILGTGKILRAPKKLMKGIEKRLKAGTKRKEAEIGVGRAEYKGEKRAFKELSKTDPKGALSARKKRIAQAHKEKLKTSVRRREFGAGMVKGLGRAAGLKVKGKSAGEVAGELAPKAAKLAVETGKRIAAAHATGGASEAARAAKKKADLIKNKRSMYTAEIDLTAFKNRLDDELKQYNEGILNLIPGVKMIKKVVKKRKIEKIKKQAFAQGQAAAQQPRPMGASRNTQNKPTVSETETKPGNFLSRFTDEVGTGTHFATKKNKKNSDTLELNTLHSIPLPTITV